MIRNRQHAVNRAGRETRLIQFLEFVRNHPVYLRALGRSRLLNLVSGAVEDDGRTIVVLLHDARHVLFPVRYEVPGIIMRVFRTGPDVRQFIHHQHAQLVAGVQHRLAHRVVRAADAVKTRRLHLFAAAFLRPIKRRRPDNAIVMVNAGAAQVHFLAIEAKTIFRVHGYCTNAEMLRHVVHRFAVHQE